MLHRDYYGNLRTAKRRAEPSGFRAAVRLTPCFSIHSSDRTYDDTTTANCTCVCMRERVCVYDSEGVCTRRHTFLVVRKQLKSQQGGKY